MNHSHNVYYGSNVHHDNNVYHDRSIVRCDLLYPFLRCQVFHLCCVAVCSIPSCSICVAVFLFDLMVTLFVAPSALGYIASLSGVVDVLSILPLFATVASSLYAFSFMRFMRLGKAFRILRLHR